MQIHLEPEVEAALAEESAALGLTAAGLSARVLTQHARIEPRKRMSDSERNEFLEQWTAHMKAANPHFETHNPYSVDWHAIKAEGRKY